MVGKWILTFACRKGYLKSARGRQAGVQVAFSIYTRFQVAFCAKEAT
ncbi:hypothetical protein EIKCOROL_00240 [Eikenella corrodens ATCC 23834]|uniref:Uncharacterized protein n=1 Tax=Eikenella corrodens ATCC 23834 TaxID=546274 RepID=C0DSB7_EIKCO|nr:hypothetical protein EIKCOROL_00240 [Eikenella corrodens ATCC 23834]